MLKAGLTGGLACGKTFVSQELERLGAHVIYSDRLGHEVLAPDGEAYAPVIATFGEGIVDGDGRISRKRLAELVFSDAARLAALNALVHPAVHRREDDRMAAIAVHEPDAVVVIEAAILIEAGLQHRFAKMIVVVCDPELQIERALARDALATRADVIARISRQMPQADKRKWADFVIDTSGTKDDALRQTREVYDALRREACQNS